MDPEPKGRLKAERFLDESARRFYKFPIFCFLYCSFNVMQVRSIRNKKRIAAEQNEASEQSAAAMALDALSKMKEE